MNIKVTKRSGKTEDLALEKWQAQVAKICEGVSDVSQSMIEITSQPHFFDGITTREIDELTLRAVVDLIDVETNPDILTISMLLENNVFLCYAKTFMGNINHHVYMRL